MLEFFMTSLLRLIFAAFYDKTFWIGSAAYRSGTTPIFSQEELIELQEKVRKVVKGE